IHSQLADHVPASNQTLLFHENSNADFPFFILGLVSPAGAALFEYRVDWRSGTWDIVSYIAPVGYQSQEWALALNFLQQDNVGINSYDLFHDKVHSQVVVSRILFGKVKLGVIVL